MKKLSLFFSQFFGLFFTQDENISTKTSITDIDIALALMGQKTESIGKMSKYLGVSLAFDGKSKIFVTMDGTTKIYNVLIDNAKVLISHGIRETRIDVISEIIINYIHGKQLHMTHLEKCIVPQNANIYNIEKKEGRSESYIKINYR